MTEVNETPETIENRTIGTQLKETRIHRNIDLAKVSESTKIKRAFLDMIESDQWTALPNLVAARGFMKIYAEFLGLDIKYFTDQFNKLFPDQAVGANSPRHEEKEIKVGLEVDKKTFFPTGLKSMNSPVLNYSRSFRSRQGQKLIKNATYVIGLIILIIGISSVYFKSTMDSIKSTPRQQSDLTQLEAKLTPEALQTMQMDQNKVYINAQATNITYLTVIIDGRLMFKGNMEKGEVKSWEGGQYIKIKASIPRNLNIYLNGKDEGVFAEQLTMLEKTYFPPRFTPTPNNDTVAQPAAPEVPVERKRTVQEVPAAVQEEKPAAIAEPKQENSETKPAQEQNKPATQNSGLFGF